MSHQRGRSPPRHSRSRSIEEESSLVSSRQLEAFGRTLGATATHLIGAEGVGHHYQHAMSEIHRELRRPIMRGSVFSLAKANPKELVRTTFSTSEIQHRALSHVPDELLSHVPESSAPYSLFQGFQASQPEEEAHTKRAHRRHNSKGQKLIGGGKDEEEGGSPGLAKLKNKKQTLNHRLEMMGIRKNMCASEIREIDTKIANLNTMRKLVLERLAGLEQEEAELEHDLVDVGNKLEDLQEELEDAAALEKKSPTVAPRRDSDEIPADAAMDASFMSESIYEKLPSPAQKPKKRKIPRRISMPVLHEHMEPGSRIRELQAHNDMITALDFDVPFGTMVTAALDDTVRVWDLNAGRCMGLLEGHLSSVRCLQLEDNICATGSMDATIRLWDLSQADYAPQDDHNSINKISTIAEDQDHDRASDDDLFSHPPNDDLPPTTPTPPTSSMADCALTTLESHVAEVTALTMRDKTLVSGSADKTLRQWDLETGRCVQTLDVLWAAAQATATNASFAAAANVESESGGWWRPTSGRLPAAEADFVGALQVFDTALACGTADGMVRLWDLRSGMVHRSLVGHTGPITALQFDDTFLVTGSLDRSVRIWDLRTGSIYDAFAYDNPITSMMFDTRRIVSACGEDVAKVYDKSDGRHWDCGAGALALEEESNVHLASVERVRIKDGYLLQGRKDGVVGIYAC